MFKNYIDTYLKEVQEICSSISQEEINNLCRELEELLITQGRLFIFGVGGSAANASHAVNDFRKILRIESYAVTDNVSELTARVNDESWKTSYSEWFLGCNPTNKDKILILSVGGGSDSTSQNLVHVMETAKNSGNSVLSIVSRDGGKAKDLSNVCVMVPVVDSDRITPHAEEWQMVIIHLIVNAIKNN